MWIAAMGLAMALVGGKVSLVAKGVPLPEAMKTLAGRLGSRLEMHGDFSDLKLTVRLQNEEPVRAVRRMVEGWPVDYYVLGGGKVIILHRRDRAGPKLVYQPKPVTPAAGEVQRAVDFISKLGQLAPEEAKRLREELERNW